MAFGAGALAVALLGLRSTRDLGLVGAGPAAAGLLGLVMLLPPLIGLVLGAGSVAGAREKGFLSMLVVQPLTRGGIVAGTFAGLVAALWVVLGIGFGVAGVIFTTMLSARDLVPLAAMMGATAALAVTTVAIGVAISAGSRTRVQATTTAVAVWFVLALGVDLALAGLVPALGLGPRGLLLAVLLDPVEAARILALVAGGLEGSTLGPFGTYISNTFGTSGAIALLLTALSAWTATALAAARWLVSRTDA